MVRRAGEGPGPGQGGPFTLYLASLQYKHPQVCNSRELLLVRPLGTPITGPMSFWKDYFLSGLPLLAKSNPMQFPSSESSVTGGVIALATSIHPPHFSTLQDRTKQLSRGYQV